NAGQGILDLMGEHGGHAVHRSHGAAMRQLAIDPMGETALLKQDDDRAFGFWQGRCDHIGHALTIARRREVDITLADRSIAFARLGDELEKRTAERHEVDQRLAQQEPCSAIEKLLGGRIDEGDFLALSDDQQGHGKRAGNEADRSAFQQCRRLTHGPSLAYYLGIVWTWTHCRQPSCCVAAKTLISRSNLKPLSCYPVGSVGGTVMSGVAVLVVAAGKGERVGGIVPKQYASLMGKPVLRWTLEALARQTDVTAIQVAIRPEQEAL